MADDAVITLSPTPDSASQVKMRGIRSERSLLTEYDAAFVTLLAVRSVGEICLLASIAAPQMTIRHARRAQL